MTPQTPNPKSLKDRFWSAIDERLGLDQLDYQVPRHGNTLPYMLGGITFVCFLVLIVTGIILVNFYDPNPANANASVLQIMNTVFLGAFIRNLHFWASQAVVIAVTLHMIRVFITASYKKPREFNWILGVILFAVTIQFYFTGTILKWDEESYQGVQEIIALSGFLGPVGLPLSPDLAPGVSMLGRIYSLHIGILPIILGVIVLGHLLYVHYFNISPLPWKRKADEPEEPKEPFMNHLKGLAKYGIILLVILTVLAMAFPAPLGPEPMTGIKDSAKPPWPMLPLTAIDDLQGLEWIIPGMLLPLLFLLAIPFIDRGEELDPRRRKIIVIIFLLGIAIFMWLLYLGILHTVSGSVTGG